MEDGYTKRYNQLWGHTPVQEPSIWSTWDLVKGFEGKKCLEVGCGNYPKIPLRNGYFLDLSKTAVENLEAKGLKAFLGTVEKLPFRDEFFDLAVAWDVIEHVDDDKKAFSEVSRVLRTGGYFLFSLPLGREKFSQMDVIAGHKRRYEIEDLERILGENSFKVLKFRCPSLFRCLEKTPFLTSLMVRIYSRPEHTRFFGLPKFISGTLGKIFAFLDRILAGSWREGPLMGIKDEVNINVFCQKISGWSPKHPRRLFPRGIS